MTNHDITNVIKKILKYFFIFWGYLTISMYALIIIIILFIITDWLINNKTQESFWGKEDEKDCKDDNDCDIREVCSSGSCKKERCWGIICPNKFAIMPLPRSWERQAINELNTIKTEQKKYKAKALKKAWTTK